MFVLFSLVIFHFLLLSFRTFFHLLVSVCTFIGTPSPSQSICLLIQSIYLCCDSLITVHIYTCAKGKAHNVISCFRHCWYQNNTSKVSNVCTAAAKRNLSNLTLCFKVQNIIHECLEIVFHLLHPICCVCVQVCAWHGRDSSLLVFLSLCHVCCFRSPPTPAHDRLYDGKFVHDILLFIIIYFSPSLPPFLLPTNPLLSSLSFSQTFSLPLFFISSLSSPLHLPL